jgi:hypothetical protein
MLTSRLTTLTALAALALAPAGQAQQLGTADKRPVMLIGGEEGVDPCALARIHDPATGEEAGSILVFAGPTTEFEVIDTLGDGDPVWVCDLSDDMLGIVYSHDPDRDCEVSSPLDADRPYGGPCASGWVKADWVEMLAG